jgi:prevent-host-death family protein
MLHYTQVQLKRCIESAAVNSFCEARTHLSDLLDQVGRGKRILITRRGKPAAFLLPPPAEDENEIRQVIEEMKVLRRGQILGEGLSIHDLIEEGRRS